MKGIILAGGLGTRLYPLTKVISKHLLPIYDKPLIYYPLSVLMFADIKDILIISSSEHLDLYKKLLNNGSQLGLTISYAEQSKPKGIAESFLIAEEWLNNSPVCLILGDNIFYGDSLPSQVKKCSNLTDGACVFAYYVKDPKRYGVVELDDNFNALSITEKPDNPKSNYAVTGLYFYDNTVVNKAKILTRSNRGELEITDLNNIYLQEKNLKVEVMGRGMAWLDTGTFASMQAASNFVQTIEERQGLKIACLEEIAYRKKFITKQDLVLLAEKLPSNSYSDYLKSLFKYDI